MLPAITIFGPFRVWVSVLCVIMIIRLLCSAGFFELAHLCAFQLITILMHIDEEQRRSRPRLGRRASWEITCMSNPHGWSWARTPQLSVKVLTGKRPGG